MSFYRTFWRWHFYAGVFVAPVLFVVAVTGGMYIFKRELERLIYLETMFITPQAECVPLEQQVLAVEAAYPGWTADTIEIDADPTRATSVRVRNDHRSQRVYVNPHSGEILGTIGDESLFRIVLDIHRRLFIGTTGRVIVETVTCWTIVLLVTGLYLWFPRRATLWGALLPRLRARPYTVLRDLHAIAGACLMPVAITIALTGLVYSLVWGNGYSYATTALEPSSAVAVKSVSSPGAPPLPLERAVAVAREYHSSATFVDVRFPTRADGPIVARAKLSEVTGPRSQVVLALDRSTGEVLDVQSGDRFGPLKWWRTTWNYSLHVGEVLGAPTKVIWLLACLVLAALPVTGLWMWWKRRPDGRSGFPRRPDRPIPWWLVALIVVLGVAFPAVGATVVVILLGEWIVRFLRPSPVAV